MVLYLVSMSKLRAEMELELQAPKAESEMPLYSCGALAPELLVRPHLRLMVLVRTGAKGTFPAVLTPTPCFLHYSDTTVKKEEKEEKGLVHQVAKGGISWYHLLKKFNILCSVLLETKLR